MTTLLRLVQRALVAIVLVPVRLYRVVLSPLKGGPTCRYLPTCSEYAIEAVRTRGVVVGSALAAWRIARCNPLFRGGFDPVPCRHEDAVAACHGARSNGTAKPARVPRGRASARAGIMEA